MYKSIVQKFGTITRVIDNNIIGVCKFKFIDKTCYINYLEVKKEFRNEKIGSEILNELENYSKQKEMNEIKLTVHQERQTNTCKFYIKNNYIQIDSNNGVYDDGQKTFDLVNMKKIL